MPDRLHVIQHAPYMEPGHIGWWALQRGWRITGTVAPDEEAYPETDAIDAVVALGGPMSVNDPGIKRWFEAERAFLTRAIEAGLPTLGVGLGAQILAQLLGGDVVDAEVPEVGWFPIELTEEGLEHPVTTMLPSSFEALCWQAETLRTPPNGQQLATSHGSKDQVFASEDHVLGLQFHLELDPAAITQMAAGRGGDLASGARVQSVSEMVEPPTRFRTAHKRIQAVLDAWVAWARDT